ncbi:MAG: site-2 protease family protein [Pirellula sp.]
MFQTIYVGKLLGIKVYIHWTFWLLAIYVVLTNLNEGIAGAISAVGFVFAVFGCVFLHEMGHALAARSFRIPTLDITLLPIGGVARMGEFPRSPVAELVVALAGPLVNVVIAFGLLLGLSIQASFSRMSEEGIVALGPLEQLLIANVALAVFNMLPAFPMDGGRVLRSLLAMLMPYSQATQYAARIGQGMAVIMFVASFFFGLSLMLIAVMVFIVCTGELIKERLVQASEQMSRKQPPFGTTFDPSQGGDQEMNDVIDAVVVRRVP